MKFKLISLEIILLISVLAACCLDNLPDSTNTNACNISEINRNHTYEDYYSDTPISVDCTGIKTIKFESDRDRILRNNSTVVALNYLIVNPNIDYVSYDPENATNGSDLVVYGTVQEVRSFWTTPDGTLTINPNDIQERERNNGSGPYMERYVVVDSEIYTHVYFKVDECVKGGCPKEITLYLPGGQIGNIVMDYGDFPKSWDFKPGDQCLLYLEEHPNEYDLIMPDGIRTVVP
ncbi:hypothetical protein MsAg5_08370 [Methanosarcinaceae archaeon Ag5]|uniref:Lipoprotein n=1 Tax=Methanolapillus africanus TaxID=3028297 RepID=A0AAE4MIS6_9EURY|nr:hypothetical protein [Methanosarcinaceae archaeon Ag5]